MNINPDKIIERIDSAIKTAKENISLESESELASTTINLLEKLYGPESQKCKSFIKNRDVILAKYTSGGAKASKSIMHTVGVLRSIKNDIKNGLLDQPKFTSKTPISFSIEQIEAAIQQFDDICNELMNSDHNTFNTRLSKLIYLVESNPVIWHVINKALFASDETSDLEKWYNKFRESIGGMLGSGDFILPPDPDQELALLFKMLKATDNGKVSEGKDFGLIFLGTNAFGKTNYDEMVWSFNDSITEPFTTHVNRRLEKMLNQVKEAALISPESIKQSLKSGDIEEEKLKITQKQFHWFRLSVIVAIILVILTGLGLYLSTRQQKEIWPPSSVPSSTNSQEPSLDTSGPSIPRSLTNDLDKADFNTFQNLLGEHRDFQQKALKKIRSALLDQLARRIIGIISSSTLPTNTPSLGENLERRLASEILVVFAKSYREFEFAEPNNMEGYLAPASDRLSLAVWVEVCEETIFFWSSLFRDETVLPYVKDYSPKLRSLVTSEKSTEQQRIELIEDLDNLIFLQDKLHSSVIFHIDSILKWAYIEELNTQSELSEKELLNLTRRYFIEIRKQSSAKSAKTLYDKIIIWGKNNPLIVGVLIFLLVIGGTAALKTNLKTLFSPKTPSRE